MICRARSVNQSINQSINTESDYTETWPALYKTEYSTVNSYWIKKLL